MSDFIVSTEYHPLEINLRSKKKATVQLAEMSEAQQRYRQNLILDPASTRGRNSGPGSVRLDRQRMYDFAVSIKDWDFTDDNGNVLPINDESFAKLPAYISRQIADGIDELNALPEDTPEAVDIEGNVVQEKSEHPFSENSV